MVNPQESLDAGILTQFSEFSDISDSSSNSKPTSLALNRPSKIIQFQFGIETPSSSSSSASFMSPGSPTDTTVVTQPPDPSEKKSTTEKKVAAVVEVKEEPTTPPAKRSICFGAENFNPQPAKKPKITCCGRCDEFRKVCVELHQDTNPALKPFQYKYHAKNSKYRAVFYTHFKKDACVDAVPPCVKEFARALYPSPPMK